MDYYILLSSFFQRYSDILRYWVHQQVALCDRFCVKRMYLFQVSKKKDNLMYNQGSHSDWKNWKTWKNGKAFSSQGKVREF